MTKPREQPARGIAAIVSRLFLVLAVALFGAQSVGAEQSTAQNGPIAVVETAFAPAILTAQNHLVRASLPEGDTPQAIAHVSRTPAPRQTQSRASWELGASAPTPAIIILPPVRGPPAV